MRARVGIIGWNYPEWRGLVYPKDAKPDAFLGHYAKLFPTVEVAASYYKFPEESKIIAWARATPDDFVFSLKVPDWITKKPTDPEVPQRIAWFLQRVEPLRQAGKLGTLVAQFPPFFRREKQAAALEAFVALLPRGPDWAIELRHDSWWTGETYRLLEGAGVTLVWSSIESGRTPAILTTDRVYARLFGDRSLEPPYDRKRRDKTSELAEWADTLREQSGAIASADIMISKFLEGYAPGSAATMDQILDLPAPAIAASARGPEQTTLF